MNVLITPTMVGQVVISGLLAGSIYALVALGLGLIFGSCGCSTWPTARS